MPSKSLLFCAALLTVLILSFVAPHSGATTISPQLQSKLVEKSSDPVSAIIILTAPETPAMLARRLGPRQRGQLVSELKRGAELNRGNLIQFLRQRDIESTRPLWLINGIAVTAPAAVLLDAASLPNVQAITLDESLYLSDPVMTGATMEWNISRTRAPQLWDLGYDGSNVTIAVLDSGVNINHPDLIGRWRGLPGDWFDPYNNSSMPYDFGTFHGTGVASIALGGNHSGSSIGMAPGANLIAAKLFRDDGTSNLSYIIEALQWVLNPGGDPQRAPAIINNSWGFTENSGECLASFGTGQNALHLRSAIQTIREAGIVVVSSAGNSGPDDNTSISPANFPESLAVGATNLNDSIAGFSSRGPSACPGDSTYPDMVAPGTNVKVAAGGSGANAGYQYVAGTSFSAPHVAGAVALLLSAVDDLEVNELETALKNAAVDLGPSGVDNTYGHGLLNVAQALFLIDESLLPSEPIIDLIGTVPDLADNTVEVLDFGLLIIGETLQKTVEIRNIGGDTLEISNITDTVNSLFGIAQNECNNSLLQTDEYCHLVVELVADKQGDYDDELTINSNDQQRPEITLLLTGYADHPFPNLIIEPSALSFGQITPGASSSRVIVLTNEGTVAVTNISFETSELLNPFSITANSCDSILEAGESCGITIRFSSDQTGTYHGLILVSSSDPDTDNLPIFISATSNSPPSRPVLISPIEGTVLSSTDTVILTWQAAQDPDGDEVTHTVVLADNPDFMNPIHLSHYTLLGFSFIAIGFLLHNRKSLVMILLLSLLWLNSCGGSGGGTTTITPVKTLSQGVGPLSPGTYYWKVIAEDGRGGVSESAVEHFVVE